MSLEPLTSTASPSVIQSYVDCLLIPETRETALAELSRVRDTIPDLVC